MKLNTRVLPDIEALSRLLRGEPSAVPVESVVAKYLINEHQED